MFTDIANSAFGILGIAFSGYGIYVLTRRDAVLETARRDAEKHSREIRDIRCDLANLRGTLGQPIYPYSSD